ncbi:MAG: TraV family lipoprotein [Alphaproteobacteria bacterium]|nr:TraV family lipoprotein [Alphaproteobacteria bacterium]
MRFFLVCFVSFLCSACGVHNDHFDCPPKPGLGCKSISEVNALVNKAGSNKDILTGNIDPKTGSIAPICDSSSKVCRVSSEFHPYDPIIGGARNNQALSDSMKIWFAPYKDEDGNYFESNFVFSTLHKTDVVDDVREKK